MLSIVMPNVIWLILIILNIVKLIIIMHSNAECHYADLFRQLS
jgi:hypothetical protein